MQLAFTVVQRLDLSKADVMSCGQFIAHKVLKNDAHLGAQVVYVVLPQVDAVEQNSSGCRVVEPQQLDNGGLSGAVMSSQCNALAWADREGNIAQHRRALVR